MIEEVNSKNDLNLFVRSRHGVVGECSVVALNFADLLINLYNCCGKELFWLSDSFDYLGDVYDN